ncbi:hypothetical protein H312_02783 [Anncaliia algerae PRA339]|uniref:Uncharacterized protein n=1 Tax=Anncaliia algerae PRA339 TaxID=1288291 RepID=A0A059EY15_9MICR|nr:hypothetical protein H312_02783 [Anncaliia algerae PRA339]
MCYNRSLVLGMNNSLICKILLISKPTLIRLFTFVFNVAIPKYYASLKNWEIRTLRWE